jgi:hypothetical protein
MKQQPLTGFEMFGKTTPVYQIPGVGMGGG